MESYLGNEPQQDWGNAPKRGFYSKILVSGSSGETNLGGRGGQLLHLVRHEHPTYRAREVLQATLG